MVLRGVSFGLVAVMIGLSGCANDPNRPPPLQLTDNNRYKQSCNPLSFSLARCAKAQGEQQRIEERKQQQAIAAEQRRIRQEQERAEWERIKNDPLNSAEIGQLQAGLQQIGYPTVQTTGFNDTATRDAIRTIQANDQRPVTGEATKEVLVAVKRKVGRQRGEARANAFIGLLGGALLGDLTGGASQRGRYEPGYNVDQAIMQDQQGTCC